MDTTNKYFLPAAVIVAGLFIAGAVMWSGARPNTGGTGTPPEQTADIKNVKTDGVPFIGSASAQLTIAVWSDFQCPFCKQFEVNTLPQIVQNYVDTGKVKVVFMDFAFLGPDSATAALYNRSVWNLYPNQYATWRAAMFAAQDAEHTGFGNAASIDALNATISGLDAKAITADVRANTAAYQAAVDADKAEAQKIGVNATPSLLIGSTLIQGAYPYANFESAIEAELRK